MSLQSRWDEAKTIAGPDIWPDIEERSALVPRRPLRERIVAATTAVAIVVIAGYFVADALGTSDREREPVVQPGASSAPTADACKRPIVQPTTLPWLKPGLPLPDPIENEYYGRITWEAPAQTEWAGAYVAVRLHTNGLPTGPEAAPPLPDGTTGTMMKHLREWYVLWQHSERYCGSIALYVFLPQESSSSARMHAIAIADSIVDQAGPDAA